MNSQPPRRRGFMFWPQLPTFDDLPPEEPGEKVTLVRPAVEPVSGARYTQVIAGEPLMSLLAGVSAIALGFFIVYPLVQSAIVWIGWAARGKPGVYQDFSAAALAFQYPEGLLASFLALSLFIPLSMFMMRFTHQRRTVWLTSLQPGMRWRFMLAVVLVAVVVLNIAYWATSGRTDFHWNPAPNAWLWVLLILVLAPLQAAGEEYLFRGYLMQLVGSVLSKPWVVILVSGVLFTAVHGWQNVPLMLDRFAFGCIMGALVVLTGGLEAAIAAHAVNNVFAFGYATLSDTLSDARTLNEVSWSVAGINIASYLVIGVLAWRIGVYMRVAVKTP